jgi:esterase/lipase
MEDLDMNLQLQPLAALCDEKVTLTISGLPPFGQVKISASMCFPWAKSVLFESHAWFTADANGQVDLSHQKPDSGSYDFVDSMGLIVSLKSTDPNGIAKIGQNVSASESLFIDIAAECGQDRAAAKLERRFMTDGIKVQRITDEFVGELFYTEQPGRKTIVWLGGSGSSLGVNQVIAAPLASHGFNVLSVPYFGEKGLPDQLSEVPLEYFERVFNWLSKNPITAGKDIQLFGMSKGGELALLLASRYPFITKVALFSPHAYSFQGLAYKDRPSWTYAGKPLPYIRLKNRWLLGNMLSCFIKNEPFTFAHTYKTALAVAKNKAAARIRVEDAQADLLIFTTGQNGMWNSSDGCIEIMDALRKNNYPHRYDLIVYDEAGEPTPVPFLIPPGETAAQLAPRLALSLGGTLKGNAQAVADTWARAIEFFG